MLETKYFPAKTIVKYAVCECGSVVKYVKSDFSKQKFCWLHACEKCKKEYWLDNRYPLTDYIVDLTNPLTNIETEPIPFEV